MIYVPAIPWPILLVAGLTAAFVAWLARSYAKKTFPPPFVVLFFGGQLAFFIVEACMYSDTAWYRAHSATIARYVYVAHMAFSLCMVYLSNKQRSMTAAPK